MEKTKKFDDDFQRILVDTSELQKILCAGRQAAVTIGTDAEARVEVGRRVFWNVQKIQKYIDSISK